MSMAFRDKVQMSGILSRISHHLERLAEQAFALEEAIGNALPAEAIGNDKTITQLQSLDHLRQSLEDLSILTIALLENQKLDTTEIDALKIAPKLRMKSSQVLLFGDFSDDYDDVKNSGGELDLF